MAVSARGRTPLVWQGTNNPSWPAGTVAGDVVLVWNANPQGGPYQSGWKYLFADTWWKRLSAADLALGPGQWAGEMLGMVAVTGCRGAGVVTTQRGVTVSEAGGAILVEGWTDYYSTAVGLGSSSDTTRLDCIRAWKSQWCAWWLRFSATKGWTEVEYDGDSMGYRAIELLPCSAPAAPTLISPAGDIDNTVPIQLQWQHNSAADLPQEQVRVRIKQSSESTWRYVTSGGALNASVQTLTTSAQTLTITVALTAVSWDWAVQTCDGGLWSEWSQVASITPRTPPSVGAVSFAQGATGEVWWTIGWPSAATPGGVQTAYQVAIAPEGAGASGAVWTGQIAASAVKSVSTSPRADWVNGATYQAWVRVQQTGGLWSPWASSAAATMSWTLPQQPGAVTVADGRPLSITVNGIWPGAEQLEIQSSPDGIEWSAAATYDLPNTVQSVDLPLAVYGLPTLYRARIWVRRTTSLGETVLLPSAWRVTTEPASSTDLEAYVVDPDTGEYLRLDITATSTQTLSQGVTTSYGLGATRPRTDRTAAAGLVGSVTARVDTVVERDALIAWLTTRDRWWLRWSPEVGKGDYPARHAEPATLMALGDQVQIGRWAAFYQSREITWAWVQARGA